MPANEKRKASTALLNLPPDSAVLLAFFLIFGSQVILSGMQKSAAFDEPVNIASGYIELTIGDYRMMPQNLPLVKQIAALPLLFLNVKLPPWPQDWNDLSRWSFATSFLYEFNNADKFLLLSRFALLPFSLLLGSCVFFWAKQLFGQSAALFSLFLFSFEPNILAHSGIVTTDLATSCFMFLTIFALYELARQVTLARLLFFALAFGASLLTKFSIFPMFVVLLLLGTIASFASEPLVVRLKGLRTKKLTSSGQKLAVFVAAFLFAGLVAYGMIWAAYRFRYEGIHVEGISYPKPWNEILPGNRWLFEIFNWIRKGRLVPEPYIYGFCYLLNKSGKFVSYLNGQIQKGSRWYYFPEAFLIKTPVPLILLFILAGPILWKRRKNYPLAASFLAVPVAIYFGNISIMGWNIGHRHLMPIYPFIFVASAALVPWLLQQNHFVKGGFAALAAWYLFSSLAIFPHYLAYFNELVGGPGNGYKYLVDSNLDWGQDLKGLKRYMEEHQIKRVWLSYFGTASPDYYGISYDYLPSYMIFKPKNVYGGLFSVDRLPPLPGIVALSVTNLEGGYLHFIRANNNYMNDDYFEFYKTQRPIAKIGYSIFVYHLE